MKQTYIENKKYRAVRTQGKRFGDSLQHEVPVQEGHEVFLHVKGDVAFLALVDREGFFWKHFVVELGQDALVIARHQGAGCVAKILKTNTNIKRKLL